MNQFKKQIAKAAFIVMVVNSCQTAQATDWNSWSSYAREKVSRVCNVLKKPKVWGPLAAGLGALLMWRSYRQVQEVGQAIEEAKSKLELTPKVDGSINLDPGIVCTSIEQYALGGDFYTQMNIVRTFDTSGAGEYIRNMERSIDRLKKQTTNVGPVASLVLQYTNIITDTAKVCEDLQCRVNEWKAGKDFVNNAIAARYSKMNPITLFQRGQDEKRAEEIRKLRGY